MTIESTNPEKDAFVDRLQKAMLEKQSVLCVGLDPQPSFFPPFLLKAANQVESNRWLAVAKACLEYNIRIIEAVKSYAVAVKPNAAFYEGSHYLMWALEETIQYARLQGLLIVFDGKRNDGSDSADAYANAYIGKSQWFESSVEEMPMHSDAMTVNPSIADACVNSFVNAIKQSGNGCFLVTKTSFKPNSKIEQLALGCGIKAWEAIAGFAYNWGKEVLGKNGYSNIGVVMGATYPEEARRMRQIFPNGLFLIPGYGAQGGGADGAVIGFNSDGFGGLVNSSRDIIAAYCKQGGAFNRAAEEFDIAAGFAAKHARDDLTNALRRAGKCAW